MKTFFETIPFQDTRDFERTLCCVQQFVRSRVPTHLDHEQIAIDSLNAFLMLDTVNPADEANRVLIWSIRFYCGFGKICDEGDRRCRTKSYISRYLG
jgi:hypothetical protein